MDANLTASLIKLYFRELPGSLFTHELHGPLIENYENVVELRRIVQTQLPVHNKKVAEVLFLLLGMVLDNIHVNKMSPNELAVIFGSILTRPENETVDTIAEVPKRAQLILTLIYNADKIFPSNLVVRSIIKKYDVPEISAQRETVDKFKGTLGDHILSLSNQLGTLKRDLDAVSSMQDIATLTKALKTLHSAFDAYAKVRPNMQLSSPSSFLIQSANGASGHDDSHSPGDATHNGTATDATSADASGESGTSSSPNSQVRASPLNVGAAASAGNQHGANASAVHVPRHIPAFVCKTLLESGHTSLQGPRPTMEDRIIMHDDLNEQFPHTLSAQTNRAFYGVFDGHAGDEAAILASEIVAHCIVTEAAFTNTASVELVKQSLADGLVKADAKIVDKGNEEKWAAGTTAVVVAIVGERLYSANLGDSEAIVCVNKGNTRVPHVLVHKHKPTDDRERDRIIAAGAPVFRGRILGKLAVSRALGDCDYKMPKTKANFVSNEAYTAALDLNETHEFIVLACDGLWDKLSHQDVIDFVHEHLALGQDSQHISELLAQHALDKGSRDNVTVIIVLLKWRPVQQR